MQTGCIYNLVIYSVQNANDSKCIHALRKKFIMQNMTIIQAK